MERVTNTIIKFVRSLSTVKGRKEHNCFVSERTKNVLELIDGPFTLHLLIGTHEWFEKHSVPTRLSERCLKATTSDLERMSTLSTPPEVIGVFEIPQKNKKENFDKQKLYLALDTVQDPGNLGTIMRLADWFGIDTILASYDTVDVFNPKTVIASMGSISRVQVVYCDLVEKLKTLINDSFCIWGTFLDGESIYNLSPEEKSGGIIVMGNEGRGITPDVEKIVSRRISIPPYPADRKGAESLNVAMATAITLAEFRRTQKS